MPHASSAPVASRQPTHIRRLLQERLDTLARAHQVPGTQLAVQVDSVTYTVQTGEADVATGERFTADTAVPLGSVTKPYTAAIVMLLAADGDLALTDLARYARAGAAAGAPPHRTAAAQPHRGSADRARLRRRGGADPARYCPRTARAGTRCAHRAPASPTPTPDTSLPGG